MTKIVNPDAAGIDISSKEHYVAVPKERCENNLRVFDGFTKDLHQLALWLKECHIRTIAMESTGVYWFQLYTILLDYGFEVALVNAHHVKNVPGRKSDVSDAQWLQQLHSFGLLRGSFQPDNITRELREYVRNRKDLINQMSRTTQHMQKALELMNIKLHNVIRDIQGVTGTRIIQSILAGERDAEQLAQYRDRRIKASKETLIKSLQGNWRDEQLFKLQQAYDQYNFFQSQLNQCDHQIQKVIARMQCETVPQKDIPAIDQTKNQPTFNVAQYLYQALGTDVTQIYGLKAVSALTIFSETGPNLLEKFPTEKQFLSWLNLVPDNKITGGKVISSRVRKKKNRAGQAFRDAASALWRAKNPIGEYLRSKKARSGSRQAIVATARKLAATYYKLVTHKVEFDPNVVQLRDDDYLRKKLKRLSKAIQSTEALLLYNQQFSEVVI
jgi:transposase